MYILNGKTVWKCGTHHVHGMTIDFVSKLYYFQLEDI